MAVLARLIRAVVAVALLAAGVLLHAASWQRWAGACPFPGGPETGACNVRQDHLYDFLVVADPWQPVGTAAQQAGVAPEGAHHHGDQLVAGDDGAGGHGLAPTGRAVR